ncbi:MAG: TonB-dependent receptor [Candidatus Pacebacteria bacterium]|nr:TonB-dependent receptor [Candidatus Paceibacterota bacterium]
MSLNGSKVIKNGLFAMTAGMMIAGSIDAWAQAPHVDKETTAMRDLVVTASRIQEDTATVPSNVTVITSEDIEKMSAQTVPEVLRYGAGIQVSDYTGTGRTATVDIRGFGETAAANTLVLVDGRRINAPDLSGVDWTTIPLERIERIEIIRGGGSVMYGDNATGGVINIITKRGGDEHRIQTDTRLGSYEFFKQSMDISGAVGDWTYDVNASYTTTDGYRDNGHFRNKTGALSLGYDADGFFAIDMSAGTKDDRYGLPGALLKDQWPTDTDAPFDYADSEEQYIRVVPVLRLNSAGELSVAFEHRYYEQLSKWVSAWGTSAYEYKLYEYGVSPKYTVGFNAFNLANTLVAGIDYYTSDLHYIQSLIPMDRHRHSTGYYVHDKIALIPDELYLNLGYRCARTKYDFSAAEDAAYNADAATVGLTYNYAPRSKVFFEFDRSFRTVLLDELGGAAFVQAPPPQISKHYQLGVRHCFGDWLTLGATLFQIDTENEIFYDPFVTMFWGVWNGENTNYEETRRRGIELELESRPHDKIRIFAHYTWMDPELKGDKYNDNEIPGVARHSGSAGVTLYPNENLTVDARARWIDDKLLISDWQNVEGEEWDDDYVVVDLMVTYDLAPFTLYAGVNNVFDQEYSEYGVRAFDWTSFNYYNAIYPSPERNFVAGIKIHKKF